MRAPFPASSLLIGVLWGLAGRQTQPHSQTNLSDNIHTATSGSAAETNDCECGYSVNSTTSDSHAVFTDLLETDFLHLQDTTWASGWIVQEYNISSNVSRGPFGKQAQAANVVANPLQDYWSWTGASKHGGDAGLQIWVRGDRSDDVVRMGEIAMKRTDAWYGSFRVAMKMTGVPGTCGAFFWV